MLEKLIKHIMSHPNVWFARCDQVAEAVRPYLKEHNMVMEPVALRKPPYG